MKHNFSRLLATIVALLCGFSAFADYTDVPYQLNGDGTFTGQDNFVFSTKTGFYQEWDHYVIFWSTGYGQHSGTPSSIGSGDYLLNLSDMKTYAEKCYDAYTKLGFLDPTSSDGKNHKIIILAYYSTGWYATGSGYGDYGTLNISHSSANPSAENPYYTFCHEIAHAYQYLGNMKNGGNAGFQYGDYYGYVSYYENCGNWQAAQVYQNLYFPQMSPVFIKTTNLAFLNQWHCYQSYLMNDYFTEKRNTTAIGGIWTINTNTKYADAPEKYMTKYGISAEDLYKEFFFAAMRMVTWDLKRWDAYLAAGNQSRDTYMDHTPGTKASYSSTTTPNTYNDNCWQHQSTYQYVTVDANNAIHQVAYSSAPQSTGFNIIKLNVPSGSNRTITTTFTALPSGSSLANGDNKEYWCGSMWATNSSISNYNTSQTSECNSNYNTYKNWRGFRLGYVTYNKSTGERKYNFVDKVFCTGTDESSVSLQFTVPENVDELCLVVSPALSQYLRMGSQDPYNITSDDGYLSAQKERDQWPYKVQFYNTNIYGLNNPSTTFNGSAEVGKTYSTEGLPDMGTGIAEDGSSSGKTEEPIVHSSTSVEISDTVSFETSATEYTGAEIELSEADLTAISECFGIRAEKIKSSSNWETWSSNGPSEGKITLYGVQSDGKTLKDTCSTADGYGFWFNADNNVCAWGTNYNSTVYAEYDVENAKFRVGQYPGALTTESSPNITVAIVFTESGSKYIAYIHIKINQIVSTHSNDILTDPTTISDIYTVDGRKVRTIQKGLNILKMSDGSAKKIYFDENR